MIVSNSVLLAQEFSQHLVFHSGQFLTECGCGHHNIVANVLLHELTSFSGRVLFDPSNMTIIYQRIVNSA